MEKSSSIPIVGSDPIIMTLVFVYITTSTKYGKKVYAVGSNMKGAQMAGINTAVVKISVFVIAGALVGIGAFLWIAIECFLLTRQRQETVMRCSYRSSSPWWNSTVGWKRKCLEFVVWR